jgi:hypothetical protein
MKNNICANKIRTKLLLKINEEIPYFKNDKMLINSISLNELNKQYNDIKIYINDPLVYSIRKRTGNTSQIKKEKSIETIDLDKKQKLSPINLNGKENDNQIKLSKILVSYKKNKHFKITAICNGVEEKKENFDNYKSPKSDYSELIKDRKKKANLCKYSINFLRAMAKKFIDRTGKHLNKNEKIFYMTPPNNKLFNRQKYESQIDLFNIFSKLNEKELIEEQNHYITTDVIPSKVPLLIPPKLNLNKDIINEYNNNEYEIEQKKSIKKYKQTSSLKNKSKKNKVLFNLEDNETITINSPIVSFANGKKNNSMCSGVKSIHAKSNRNKYHQSLSSILTKPNLVSTSKTTTNIFQNNKINKIKNSYKELYGDDDEDEEINHNIKKYLNKSNKHVNEFYQDNDYSD